MGVQRSRVTLDKARHVEQDAAVDQQVGWELIDGEVSTDVVLPGPDPVRVARRQRGVHFAEQRSVAADVADRVDARGAVLAAEVHDFGGKGQLPAIAKKSARIGVRGDERERIGRIDRGNGRELIPGVGKIDQARLLDSAQKLASAPRVIVVGKRRRELSQAKCGEGAREYRAGGTVHADCWLGHGFLLLFKVYGKIETAMRSLSPARGAQAEPSAGALACRARCRRIADGIRLSISCGVCVESMR